MALLEKLIAEPPPIHMDEDGVARIGGTRVTLDTVIGAYYNGCVPEQIIWKYPSLKIADVYAVITYYLQHREEIDAYLEERRRQAEEIRSRNEALFPPQGVRERLLQRRAEKP